MTLPVTFANLPTGNNPASLLDQEFAAVAAMATTYCAASGTNAILLTPTPNQPVPTSYPQGARFSFIPAATNTGPVTMQVGSLAAIPIYNAGHALTGGELIASVTCTVVINGVLGIADLQGGSGSLPVTGGTLTGITTSTVNNGFTISVPAGQPAQFRSFVTGAHDWTFGTMTSGYFRIADNTATLERLTISAVDGRTTLGLNVATNIPGAVIAGGGVNYSTYSTHNIAFNWTPPLVVWVDNSNVGTVTPVVSDPRYKDNIGEVEGDPLAELLALKLISYDLLNPAKHFACGFDAAQMEAIIADATHRVPDGENEMLSLDLMPLLARCIGAIQTLTARLAALEAKR